MGVLARITKINLAVQLIVLFGLTIAFGNLLPEVLKSALLAISISLKDILLTVLPFIIFSCLFYSMVANQGKALRFVLILLVVVVISNFISLLAAYGIGAPSLSYISLMPSEQMETLPKLSPLWTLPWSAWISGNASEISKWVLIFGFVTGFICSFIPSKLPHDLGAKANHFVTVFLKKGFIPLLPLFSLGFIVQMQHEGILTNVLISYLPIVLVLFFGNLTYILIMFFIAAKGNVKVWGQYLRNVLPVGILGFTTMSSLATMPVTLAAAEKNTQDPLLARAIIPATVNIHMVGDSITTPIVVMAVLMTFGMPMPTFVEYLMFMQVYMLIKFTIPGVPCGAILVLIPTLEGLMGYTPEMTAFLTAIFVLFDSILTASNVLGNSALAIILTRIMKWFPKKASDLAEVEPSEIA